MKHWSTEFRPKFYPDAADTQWDDWRWQYNNRITERSELCRLLGLEQDQVEILGDPIKRLPLAITPYYASLIEPGNPSDPIRQCVVPSRAECEPSRGEVADPLGEETRTPVPGIVHRYPDRVLMLVSNRCPTYCRYCTRGRQVGNDSWRQLGRAAIRRCIDYVAADSNIHDVLISGGEPLLLGDAKLGWLLDQLQAIPHVDYVRIGTKAPLSLPQRITTDLCSVLRQSHPIFLSIHATHPNELTAEAIQALTRLADAGIVVGSQTVLLRDVNDNAQILTALFRGLLRARVRPYYLLQCDPMLGTARFRTPVQRGIDLLGELQGRISGYAIPRFILDIPGGAGKIPLSPDYTDGYSLEGLRLRSPYGETGFIYPDC